MIKTGQANPSWVLPATAQAEQVTDVLLEHGYAVVEKLISDETVDCILEELKEYREANEFIDSEFEGRHTRRTGAILARSKTARPLCNHPLIVGVGDRILGKNATTWQFAGYELIEIYPGESGQTLHRDPWKFDYFPFPPGFETEVECMWAFTDFTEENGATRVVQGSHKWPDNPRIGKSHDDMIAVECPKGSLILYLGSTYHGGGANRSRGSVRIGLSGQYSLGWLRQDENQYLSCPPEVAREFPEDLLRLIGYQMGADSLGSWRDSEDPISAVFPDRKQRGWMINSDDGSIK